MDHQSFINLSKFTVEARKMLGAVNPAKLVKDAAYREQVFEKVHASDNAALIVLARQLQDQLTPPPVIEPLHAPFYDSSPEAIPALPANKYIYGARG